MRGNNNIEVLFNTQRGKLDAWWAVRVLTMFILYFGRNDWDSISGLCKFGLCANFILIVANFVLSARYNGLSKGLIKDKYYKSMQLSYISLGIGLLLDIFIVGGVIKNIFEKGIVAFFCVGFGALVFGTDIISLFKVDYTYFLERFEMILTSRRLAPESFIIVEDSRENDRCYFEYDGKFDKVMVSKSGLGEIFNKKKAQDVYAKAGIYVFVVNSISEFTGKINDSFAGTIPIGKLFAVWNLSDETNLYEKFEAVRYMHINKEFQIYFRDIEELFFNQDKDIKVSYERQSIFNTIIHLIVTYKLSRKKKETDLVPLEEEEEQVESLQWNISRKTQEKLDNYYKSNSSEFLSDLSKKVGLIPAGGYQWNELYLFLQNALYFGNISRSTMALLDYFEMSMRAVYYYLASEKGDVERKVNVNLLAMGRYIYSNKDTMSMYGCDLDYVISLTEFEKAIIQDVTKRMYIEIDHSGGDSMDFLGFIYLTQLIRNKIVCHGTLTDNNVRAVQNYLKYAALRLSDFLAMDQFKLIIDNADMDIVPSEEIEDDLKVIYRNVVCGYGNNVVEVDDYVVTGYEMDKDSLGNLVQKTSIYFATSSTTDRKTDKDKITYTSFFDGKLITPSMIKMLVKGNNSRYYL